MNLHIEGNGIHQEIIVRRDGQSITRLLELSGGNPGDGLPGRVIAQGRSKPSGGFAEAVQRAIKEVAREARAESV